MPRCRADTAIGLSTKNLASVLKQAESFGTDFSPVALQRKPGKI
jgi:hypothetical protein